SSAAAGTVLASAVVALAPSWVNSPRTRPSTSRMLAKRASTTASTIQRGRGTGSRRRTGGGGVSTAATETYRPECAGSEGRGGGSRPEYEGASLCSLVDPAAGCLRRRRRRVGHHRDDECGRDRGGDRDARGGAVHR